MAKRRIPDATGQLALDSYRTDAEGFFADTEQVGLAVRYLLQLLGDRVPGRSVEVRVPPFGAAQVVEGIRHTRGTPPATVEMDAETFLELALGTSHWSDLADQGRITASGERSNLREFFPLRPLS